MSIYGTVNVGPHVVSRIDEGITTHLFAVLRDDAVTPVPSEDEDESQGQVEFRLPGRQMADRLDVLGIDELAVLEALAEVIADRRARAADWADDRSLGARMCEDSARERDHLDRLDPLGWIAEIRDEVAAAHDHTGYFRPTGSLGWLLDLVDGLDYRYALRLGLLAFPDEQVTVTVTDRGEGWLCGDNGKTASDALQAMQSWGSTYSPTVVLTEGRTDAEFLSAALSVLYPHLTDLVRFMDFDGRPEGSAAALVKSVKSFAAAGISNRIVALFDNDSAAADATHRWDTGTLPGNFYVGRYPDLDIARSYPTLGPPSTGSPTGVLSTADVNGLAGSIELYLGRDALTGSDGNLRPVQWTSFLPGVKRYQGEVAGKGEVQESYRAKVAAARRNDGRPLAGQDWSGLDAILQLVIRPCKIGGVSPLPGSRRRSGGGGVRVGRGQRPDAVLGEPGVPAVEVVGEVVVEDVGAELEE